MKHLLVKIIIAPFILIGSFFHKTEAPTIVSKVEIQQMINNALAGQSAVTLGNDTLPINGSTYNLSGSGVTSSASSFTLSSLTVPQNGYKIVDADASATFYMTLEPGSRTRQEVVSCTTIVQNVAGTATISGCTRGLSPISPYTASTTLKFAHPGGSQVIFGNAAQLFNEYAGKLNAETITGLWTYPSADATRARIDSDTDTAVSTAFVTLGQLSRQAISGASNGSQTAKGIFEGATAIEQASSTSAGSTSALLVKLALFSTSSPIVGCNGTSLAGALCSVIAQNNGKIDPNFISTTSVYRFTGNNTYSGLSTFSGSVVSSSTNIHSGQNTFLGTTTMATTTATDLRNGAGASYGGKLAILTTPLDFGASSTATSTIFSFNLPGNFLATSSIVHLKIYFDNGGSQGTQFSSGTFRFALNYGGVGKAYISVPFTTASGASGFFDAVLMGNGATNSQYGMITVIGQPPSIGSLVTGIGGSAVGTYSIDSTVNQTVSVTASFGSSDSANAFYIHGGYAEIIN